MHFVTVDPVHHKLWQERTGVLLRDTGQTERFIYRRVGLPVSGNACGLRTVVHLAGVFKPPPTYMFDKTGIHFFGRTAALAPIQDEFRPDRFGKHNVDIGLSQNIESVLTGHPVAAEGDRRGDFKRVCRGLLVVLLLGVAPACQHVLPKLGINLSSASGRKVRAGMVYKALRDAMIQHQ